MNTNDPKYKARHRTYRRRHTAIRNRNRKANYDKTKPKVRKHKPWEDVEEALVLGPILIPNYSDRELSKILGRSVQAIQNRRYLLKCQNGKK